MSKTYNHLKPAAREMAKRIQAEREREQALRLWWMEQEETRRVVERTARAERWRSENRVDSY